jgi:inhibitor of KinA sporulation pathway (predicted exonuclease)
MQQLESEVGIVTALEKLGLPLEGTLHRGVDDAWNIAKILAELLKKLLKFGVINPRATANCQINA